MDSKQKEILIIAQEEAAEVIQEISKIFRFGLDDQHKDGMTHRQRLQSEIGDLLCMIDLMTEHGLADPVQIEMAKQAKTDKLRRYSSIYPYNHT